MAEKKECENCKHGDVYFKDEPCRSCDEHYSLWESLTYTPPDTAPPDELERGWTINHPCKKCGSIDYCECSCVESSDELDREAQKLVEVFIKAMPAVSAGYPYKESKAKEMAIIHIEGLKAENLSMLEMAKLHMDERATVVLNDRICHLEKLQKKIEDI